MPLYGHGFSLSRARVPGEVSTFKSRPGDACESKVRHLPASMLSLTDLHEQTRLPCRAALARWGAHTPGNSENAQNVAEERVMEAPTRKGRARRARLTTRSPRYREEPVHWTGECISSSSPSARNAERENSNQLSPTLYSIVHNTVCRAKRFLSGSWSQFLTSHVFRVVWRARTRNTSGTKGISASVNG